MTDPVLQSLNRYMDALSFRQKLVSANIANADTPLYKTKDIDFHAELKSALSSGFEITEPDLQTKTDGNNVSLDRESRLLAENALRFSMASGLLKSQLRQVKAAIQEGR